ncbi:RrF2 family transcriptional regulator [Ramlibacter sp. MAHUQ-53]|uniref:RrF2 family transcriptional regulator n=1 Tax=unclassified Ramlibacter TaxID=2617605 RepID=UPI003628ED05
MKLSAFTDYSLRVLIYLAAQPGQRATIARIAQAFDVSENHLVKVVHFLGRQGWLATVRGKGGGIELGLAPGEIGVGAVVRATEGGDEVAECFGEELRCAIEPACRLRGVLREALEAFYAVLDRYTLADLARNRHQIARILFIEPVAAPADAARRR